MGILDSIQTGISNHFEKKKREREMMEQLQTEAQMQQRIIFQEEYKKNALEVARARAKKDAAKLSGLQKLRAINRARRLTESGQEPGSMFSKLSEYTQKNLARREENIKRTAEMRETAKKIQVDKLVEQNRLRDDRMIHNNRKPFNNNRLK